jgi:hypothetical protein
VVFIAAMQQLGLSSLFISTMLRPVLNYSIHIPPLIAIGSPLRR